MSDSGIETAPDDGDPGDADETLVEARMAALEARYPERFSAEEAAAIRDKVARGVAVAKTLHEAHLDPDVEPPPFVPYSREEKE